MGQQKNFMVWMTCILIEWKLQLQLGCCGKVLHLVGGWIILAFSRGSCGLLVWRDWKSVGDGVPSSEESRG
jgi:hypothetical protein